MHWNMDWCSCMSLHTSFVANVRRDDNKDPGMVGLICIGGSIDVELIQRHPLLIHENNLNMP